MVAKKTESKDLKELQVEVQDLEVQKSRLTEEIGAAEIKIKELSLKQQQIVTIINQAVLDAYKAQAFPGNIVVPSGGNAQFGDKQIKF